MHCVCLQHCERFLEQLGIYEPALSIEEATSRLEEEKILWDQHLADRNQAWKIFQSGAAYATLNPFVERAIVAWEGQMGAKPGIAVDLGCGISPTTFALLDRGWTVYAVDQSEAVLEVVERIAKERKKQWLKTGQLVIVCQSIEEFQYPKEVQLILATDALPYCNPSKIAHIFSKAQQALAKNGVFACSFFSYHTEIADDLLRSMFGAWLTTRNVIEAVAKSTPFKTFELTMEPSVTGLAQQIRLIARA